ncbi:PaaI family thioesterase [Aquisalimonas sp.]|uniref:PaaI family thioesterase n=1 Tax=unclassified Aquisalimonas TaxID=2644645 RepID=UPI0025B8BADF|nr:PaaI family thioesterase [Aquisalimonas sp.]
MARRLRVVRRSLASVIWGVIFSVPAARRYFGRRFFNSIPHSRRMGLRVTRVGRRSFTAGVGYRDELVGNPYNGHLHGGVLTTLIDQTSGAAAFFSRSPPQLVATLDLRIDHLRPAAAGKDVEARAECYHVTRHIAFVRCVAYDDDPDDPVATSVSAFMRNGPVPLGRSFRR